MPNHHLVLYDVDNIKGYIFASGRLKEIRGASLLVQENTSIETLTRWVRHDSVLRPLLDAGQIEILYADGAAGKLLFPDGASAQHFCGLLARQYHRATKIGSVTTAVVAVGDDFAAAVSAGEVALRRNKLGRNLPQQLAGGGLLRVCASCGLNPAHSRGQDSEWLCAACDCKRRGWEAVDQRRQAAAGGDVPALTGRADFDPVLWSALNPAEHPAWRQAQAAGDLNELGQMSRPAGYLGFVYCDANDVGGHWQAIAGTPDDYRRFSQSLGGAVRQAAAEALSAACDTPRQFTSDNRQPVSGVPFEILILGGDDLALLVPAEVALEVALNYCRAFERLTAASSVFPRRVTASAGVVLAHASQPVLYLEQRAGELLKLAKGFGSADQGAIDFHVQTSPTLNPVSHIRRVEYERGTARLTRRPYTLEEFEHLLRFARLFRFGRSPRAGDELADPERLTFPRNKLNALYQAVFRSDEQASFETAFALLRLADANAGLLRKFFDHFKCGPEFPWGRDAQNTRFTALTDLVEILEFVSRDAAPAQQGAAP